MTAISSQQNTPYFQKNMAIPSMKHSAQDTSNGIEQFALPSWLHQYSAPTNDLSLSVQAIKETKQYMKSGPASSANDQLKFGFDAYFEAASATQSLKQQWLNQEKFKSELSEYGQYKHQAFDAAMKSINAQTIDEYHSIIKNDPSKEGRAHMAFKESLYSNPNVESLMNVLGINRTG